MDLRGSLLSPEHQSANKEGLNSLGAPGSPGKVGAAAIFGQEGAREPEQDWCSLCPLPHHRTTCHWTHLLYQNDSATSDPYLQPQARLTNISPCHSWPLAALCPCRATPQKVLTATNTIRRCLQRTPLRDELWESDFH